METDKSHRRMGRGGLTPMDCILSLGIESLLLVAVCCLMPLALSGGEAGKDTANFLKMGVGGRGVGMGEAHTAAVDDVMSLYWNPAGLAGLTQDEVGFMRNSLFQGISQDVLYYARPTEKNGTFGGGVSLLRVGDIAGFDASNVHTGNLSATDMMVTGGWGQIWENAPWLPGLQTGVNLKFLQKKLANDSATGYMADLGLLYHARDGWLQGLRTGLAVQNVGTGLTFIGEKTNFPRIIKAGLAYPLFGENMTTALDVVLPDDNDLYLNMGLDYRLWDILALRVGYKGQNDLDTGLAYGMRLGNERLHVDYAFTPFGALGDSHRVSVGLRFGRVYRQSQVQTQIRRAYERAESRYAQGYLVDAYIQANQILDVAPWHSPSKTLMRRIQKEFDQLESVSRREQLKRQIDDHFVRGEQHFQLDDLLPARREFQAILALQPDHVGAKTYLKRIENRFQAIVEGFYKTAMEYFAAGDYAKSKDYLEKVLVVDPQHAEAREQLSRTEILLTQVEKAQEERARMEAVRPIYKEALSMFEGKNYEGALRKFEDILALDSGNNEAKRYRLLCRDLVAKEAYEKANAAARDGEWESANEFFKKALKYKPDFAEAQTGLDRVRGHLGEQRKGESQKYYKMGLESFLSGDQDKALEYWKKSVELDPENLEAKRGLERIEQRRGSGQ